MKESTQYAFDTELETKNRSLESVATKFFLGQKSGQMGAWEYGASLYPSDPAGGADFWAEAIKRPGAYYLAQGERDLIRHALSSDTLIDQMARTKTLVEFGPGSANAIEHKTIPLMKRSPNLSKYIAIDGSMDQARQAAHMITNACNIRSDMISTDFTKGTFKRYWEGLTTYIMWGCTIGNLPGLAGQNPYPSLVQEIQQLQKTLLLGDTLVLIFDTNDDEDSILRAYNEPALKRQSLSWLHGLKRDGIATGNFDPRVWVHEPVWFSDVMQCAHTVFPMFDQSITIGGHTIEIPAWRRFVSNNSYKFSPDVMIAAAEDAGLKAQVLQQGPMAMLIAEK